ncbi:MAG: Rrf2 family transcriptional regulator [Clostridiales bacterium]|nr:Rrf2 family transcriptional regulator [Clostridia bacterium]MCR5353509.1 Rrf2 family transcriptional regulator [Clostridiales bacterium]
MISTKGRYALRVMIDLAEHDGKKCIPLKEIAERQEISKKYLEIIVKDLVKSKLIVGIGGKGGGYRLCRKPEEYTAGEIIESAEGPFITVACLAESANECPRASCCKTLPLWAEFDKITHNYFFSKKLSDLL